MTVTLHCRDGRMIEFVPHKRVSQALVAKTDSGEYWLWLSADNKAPGCIIEWRVEHFGEMWPQAELELGAQYLVFANGGVYVFPPRGEQADA